MGCWGRNRARLLCMLSLTFMFMVLEVVVSRLTSSLAMLSDSFHMLSDVLALIVALVAERFARRTQSTQKNTFGWIRAEVMGALVNAIFLTGLCFAILLEAIERFIEPHEMQQPLVVLGVGVAGLVVNLLGLCLFHHHSGYGGGPGAGSRSHSHSHGGLGHSHSLSKGSRGKNNRSGGNNSNMTDSERAADGEETNNLVISSNGMKLDPAEEQARDGAMDVQVNGNLIGDDSDNLDSEDEETSGQLNMRGVFLHVFGDALGSVIVVINALVFFFSWKSCTEGTFCRKPCIPDPCDSYVDLINTTYTSTTTISEAGPCWVLYLDPTLCLVMVGILLYTTYPLLKESALILLQTVPKQIDIRNLKMELRNVEGVEEVHELHVWQLAGSRIIATAHIKCHDPTSYMEVAKSIKDVFHNHGIHATTIQPEFASVGAKSSVTPCELACRTQCALKQCCGTAQKTSSGKETEKSSAVSISCLELSDNLEKHPRRTKVDSMPAVMIDIKKMPNEQPESSM
ncbi:zinc transporter 1 [Sarcophilus harrisii]|uniref:Solute carrier family 30 member 1 n=1 Tax=Sarcophilus harrisii TaxID=9305 RepID=G3WQM6_SARHA|nr:zinc transporter 1 [Sarcophilus harrisii]